MHEHIERLSTQLAEVANSQGALTPFQVRTLRTRIGVEPLGLHCVLTLCFRVQLKRLLETVYNCLRVEMTQAGADSNYVIASVRCVVAGTRWCARSATCT